MKYDDAEYFFLNFETEQDQRAAYTHIGMYLAWAQLRGLSQALSSELGERRVTGATLLENECDSKLTAEEFNAEGNAFTAHYYEKHFVVDYQRVFELQMPRTGHATDDFCGIDDTWENFDRLAPLLDKRLAAWRAGGAPDGGEASGDGQLSLVPKHGAAAIDGDSDAEGSARLATLHKLAAQGDAKAWHDIGHMYIEGDGVPRDERLASDAFEEAAKLGEPVCMFNIGVRLWQGVGREIDEPKGVEWLTKAARLGEPRATYMLGVAYKDGVGGLQKDRLLCEALVLLARKTGMKEAVDAPIREESLAEATALAERLRGDQKGFDRIIAQHLRVAAARLERTEAANRSRRNFAWGAGGVAVLGLLLMFGRNRRTSHVRQPNRAVGQQ